MVPQKRTYLQKILKRDFLNHEHVSVAAMMTAITATVQTTQKEEPEEGNEICKIIKEFSLMKIANVNSIHLECLI